MGVRFPSLALICFCFSLLISGCATSPYVKPPLMPQVPGIYHRIERGQTLWAISRMYNFDLDELARINHILDSGRIEAGQLLFIPRSKPAAVQYNYSQEDFIWPLKGRVIANFGETYNNLINKGINIQPYRNNEVVAARSGKVVFYLPVLGFFGKTIIIDHGDGFSTVYARNSQVFVKVGDNITKGAVIARVGSTPQDKNQYLHFQIRKGHIPKNPYYYLP